MRMTSFISRELGKMNPGSKNQDGGRGGALELQMILVREPSKKVIIL